MGKRTQDCQASHPTPDSQPPLKLLECAASSFLSKQGNILEWTFDLAPVRDHFHSLCSSTLSEWWEHF